MPQHPVEVETRRALLKRGIPALIDQGDNLGSILNRLIQNVEAQTEQMLAAIFFYDPKSKDLCVGAAPNLQPVYVRAVNGFRVGPQQPACGSAAFKGERVIASDIETDPLWENLREFAKAANIRAVWSQPIFDDEKNVLGTLAFYFPYPKAPDKSNLVILEATAEIASMAIRERMDQFANVNRMQRARLEE